MIGENFEIYLSEMAKNELKLSTIVGENFEIYLSEMAINGLKLSTNVGEKSEIYLSEKLKVDKNCPPRLEKILKFTCRKCLKMD